MSGSDGFDNIYKIGSEQFSDAECEAYLEEWRKALEMQKSEYDRGLREYGLVRRQYLEDKRKREL